MRGMLIYDNALPPKHLKVDVPSLVISLDETPIFKWYMYGLVCLEEHIPKQDVFIRYWTALLRI